MPAKRFLPILAAGVVAVCVLALLRTGPSSDGSSPTTLAEQVGAIPTGFAVDAAGVFHSASSDLAVAVDATGMQLTRPGGQQVRLGITAYGNVPVGALGPVPNADRYVDRCDGTMRAFYWHRDDGVVCGYTVRQRPVLAEPDRLELRFAVDGDYRLALGHAGESLLLHGSHPHLPDFGVGTVEVEDARGRSLPASFVVNGPRGYSLVVDDSEATYPVRVYPVVRPVEPMAQAKYSGSLPLPQETWMAKVSIYVEDLRRGWQGSPSDSSGDPEVPSIAANYARFGYWNSNQPFASRGELNNFLKANVGSNVNYQTYVDAGLEAEIARFEQGIVYLPVGPDNRWSPGPANKGQTTMFQSGRGNSIDEYADFAVHLEKYGIAPGTNLVWIANGKTTTFGYPDPNEGQLCPVVGESTIDQYGNELVLVGVHNKKGPKGSNVEPTDEPKARFPRESIAAQSWDDMSPAPADRSQPYKYLPGSHPDLFVLVATPADGEVVWFLNGFDYVVRPGSVAN